MLQRSNKIISKSLSKRMAVQKPKRKAKRKSIAGLVEDAATLLQKIRRIESADGNGYCACVSCGAIDHYKNMDGGHWIPRTKTATKLHPKNIHPQCKSCNHFRKAEAAVTYSQYMYRTYGTEFCDHLITLSKLTAKHTRPALMEMIETFKIRLGELGA